MKAIVLKPSTTTAIAVIHCCGALLIMIKPLVNKNGITIKQLKELVKDLPEQDENGEDFELWVMNTDGSSRSNVAKSISQLNKGDLIVEINP